MQEYGRHDAVRAGMFYKYFIIRYERRDLNGWQSKRTMADEMNSNGESDELRRNLSPNRIERYIFR